MVIKENNTYLRSSSAKGDYMQISYTESGDTLTIKALKNGNYRRFAWNATSPTDLSRTSGQTVISTNSAGIFVAIAYD